MNIISNMKGDDELWNDVFGGEDPQTMTDAEIHPKWNVYWSRIFKEKGRIIKQGIWGEYIVICLIRDAKRDEVGLIDDERK